MQEYWVNVYEYKTIKNTQFLSHKLKSKHEAYYREAHRRIARPDCRVIYRIRAKLKSVPGFKRDYPFKFVGNDTNGKPIVVSVCKLNSPKYDDWQYGEVLDYKNWMS